MKCVWLRGCQSRLEFSYEGFLRYSLYWPSENMFIVLFSFIGMCTLEWGSECVCVKKAELLFSLNVMDVFGRDWTCLDAIEWRYNHCQKISSSSSSVHDISNLLDRPSYTMLALKVNIKMEWKRNLFFPSITRRLIDSPYFFSLSLFSMLFIFLIHFHLLTLSFSLLLSHSLSFSICRKPYLLPFSTRTFLKFHLKSGTCFSHTSNLQMGS